MIWNKQPDTLRTTFSYASGRANDKFLIFSSWTVAPTEFLLLETWDTLLKEDWWKIGLET